MRQTTIRLAAVFLIVALAAGATPVAADTLTPSAMQSGGLLLRMQNGYRTATLLNTEVDFAVSGLVSRAIVRQVFRNEGSEWVEGVYVFPLPDKAAVDHMRIRIGERFVEGEIREKQKARKEYETARAAGKKASLVEQQRANLFTTSVANIGPGELVTVEIEYLEDVRYEDGIFSLRFPLTLTPRYIPGQPLSDQAYIPGQAPYIPGQALPDPVPDRVRDRSGSGWSADTDQVDDASLITPPMAYIPGQALPDPVPDRVRDRSGLGWSADTDQVADASLITPPMVARSTAHRVRIHASVHAGVPLSIIASRYHPVNVSESGGRYTVELAGSTAAMDHDFELLWRPVASAVPRAMAFRETLSGDPHLLLMVMPPDTGELMPPLMPREMIFVIDTSGSMHGTSIEQAKTALARALDGLQAKDRFNVIEFNSFATALYRGSMTATADRLDEARRFVARLEANGGTEMRTALELALNDPPSQTHLRQVIFITDGSVGNEDELYGMIERRLGPARLFTVGIGSAPNGWFMRKASELGRGSFTLISSQHEIAEKVDRLFAKLEHPQITNIEVHWPGGVAVDAYPGTIPDLYRGEPVTIRVRAEGEFPAGAEVTISGDSIGGAWRGSLPLTGLGPDLGVAALWARARIGFLLDEGRRGADPATIRQAVIDTALEHHLVSKYTSLVAVDKTPVRPAGDPLTQEQLANLMPHGQNSNAIFGFPATATNARLLVTTGLACLFAGTLLLTIRRRRPVPVPLRLPRSNGIHLSDFRSFRGSGILPRSVAAVGHSSRQDAAPTRRCASSQCHCG